MAASPFVILDNARAGHATVFIAPSTILEAREPDEVFPALAAMQAALDGGRHLAGYFSYELGYLLEDRLKPLLPRDRTVPLLWFGVFDTAPEEFDGEAAAALWEGGRAYAGPLNLEWDQDAYASRFARVADWIVAGDIFQANLSFRARFPVVGEPRALYRELRRHAAAAHGAFIDDGTRQVLSVSPELFFETARDGAITARPMKGTAPRGADPKTDEALRAGLAASPKDRAENLMIVDLLRNDLGRVAQLGSVAVRDLFAVETYPTLHTMVSTVTARLKPATRVEQLLRALFPCGSVTGAPKIRAMQVIRELEQSPRGIYCGAIGHFAPDGGARFNVAIRTLTLAQGRGELGIGGAVVFDSSSAAEYAECLLKARYYEAARLPLALIETLRHENGVFVRLPLHLGRMAASAGVFGLAFDAAAAQAALDAAVADRTGALRVRLMLDEAGRFAATAAPLGESPARWRYAISPHRLDSGDELLRHKTSWREIHDGEAARLAATCDEVLFLNARGELCEGARSNLFLEKNGVLFTPAAASGLLDGCLRRELLASGKCREAILTQEDLAAADAVYFGNSLRGLIAATPAGA